MTPLSHHRIHLADGSVLYSEGVGSVQFIPEVNGHKMAPLEFTNVLYVPTVPLSDDTYNTN